MAHTVTVYLVDGQIVFLIVYGGNMPSLFRKTQCWTFFEICVIYQYFVR